MKKTIWSIIALALAVALIPARPTAAQEQKGTMQIGLAARYAWPGMDFESFDPTPVYGVVFHYFLTSTTSVDGNLDYLALSRSIDSPDGGVDLDYTMASLAVGLRYRPKLDLVVRPFGEIGVGYEFWNSQVDLPDAESRSGNSIIYFGGLGYDWEVYEDFTLTTTARYYFIPMNERLESEVVSTPGGGLRVEREDLLNASLLTAGIELTWRFK